MKSYIDEKKLLGYEFEPYVVEYTVRDAIIYALGIGAGQDPENEGDLKFLYEQFSEGFVPFPTYSVNFGFGFLPNLSSLDGLEFDPMMLLHGEQQIEFLGDLPASGTITNNSKITDIQDKGSGALIVLEVVSVGEDQQILAINTYKVFIRGLGGFGGNRGENQRKIEIPQKNPDAVHEQVLNYNQAALYRLSGDKNPLHIDPVMAGQGGFERPILHGLCTFGFAARAVSNNYCDGDPRLLKLMSARFSKHVFPGETLQIEMWEQEDLIIFQARVKERNELVLTNGQVKLSI